MLLFFYLLVCCAEDQTQGLPCIMSKKSVCKPHFWHWYLFFPCVCSWDLAEFCICTITIPHLVDVLLTVAHLENQKKYNLI